ncbi:MAG: riboflavin biosynthesis protein RibF [Bdellovibrionota bacterium]|nr:MAG: riboflavin biosynthesis protein RibF [Bdellovibrionota bacterium]
MIVRRGGPTLPSLLRPVSVTFGNFDGVHRGHQRIMRALREQAGAQGSVVVVSFYPHPVSVVRGISIPRIFDLHENAAAFERYGVDVLYLLHFSEPFSKLAPERFIHEYLLARINADVVVTGPDARFGRSGAGDVSLLRSELLKVGRRYLEVPFFEEGNERISSRRVRELIVAGEVQKAALLMGHPYRLRGRIQAGAGRGRTIGVPTANMRIARELVRPAYGVYASTLECEGTVYPAVTNIGVRPTVDGQHETVESHVLGRSPGTLYGKSVRLALLAHLRAEQRFPSLEALKTQIQVDIAEAQRILQAIGIMK